MVLLYEPDPLVIWIDSWTVYRELTMWLLQGEVQAWMVEGHLLWGNGI